MNKRNLIHHFGHFICFTNLKSKITSHLYVKILVSKLVLHYTPVPDSDTKRHQISSQ